jgi:hypothetical protein
VTRNQVLEVGTPVRITKEYPDLDIHCRVGVIVEHCPQNGGYLVKHAEPDPDLKDSPIALVHDSYGQTFGWAYDEVEPLQ